VEREFSGVEYLPLEQDEVVVEAEVEAEVAALQGVDVQAAVGPPLVF
jgi:hypothetical protein